MSASVAKSSWIFLLGHVHWKPSNGSAMGLTCWNISAEELGPLSKIWLGREGSAG